ncbi:MAG: Coq4 family protein [Planctomycetota bacterium]
MELPSFLSKHKNHHQHTSYLTFIKGGLGLMANPEHTASVFDMEDGLRGSGAEEQFFEFTSQDPAVQEIIKERYLQSVPDTERLADLPEGSLGKTYVTHLSTMGFDPDYYRKIDVRTDVDYVLMRIRQTHDIWHVVTGFDTHPLGEICVKACELAQTHRPMAGAICAGGLYRYLFKQPGEFNHFLESVAAGYRLGIRAKPLLAQKWEEQWDRPVDEIRKELKVTPLGPRGGQLDLSTADAREIMRAFTMGDGGPMEEAVEARLEAERGPGTGDRAPGGDGGGEMGSGTGERGGGPEKKREGT